MLDYLIQLLFFTAQAFIVVLLILFLFAGLLTIISKGREKFKQRLTIKNLNQKYNETREALFQEILPKKLFKKFLKERKSEDKNKHKTEEAQKNIFILNFHGDLKASGVHALREEITAILAVATPKDEVIVRLESPGGMVNAYGLAAAQLLRIRNHQIPLTVSIDKVAASGGYLMACVANKIISAPFAIIGSIGVIVQMPNFHRLLKDKHIDFEQLTAGSYKRTLSLFGENTEEGRHKLQQEIDVIHQYFKNLITTHRPQIDIQKVATGEYWLGEQALALQLVDGIKTSDDYLSEQAQHASLYEIALEVKKPLGARLFGPAHSLREKILGEPTIPGSF